VDDPALVAAHAATRDRVRAASAAASAAAATAAMPGELEDLGGPMPEAPAGFDAGELARLRAEVQQRKVELTKSMSAAREASIRLAEQASAAAARGDSAEAAQLERRADHERQTMHALLAELATLETELAELERVSKSVPRDLGDDFGAGARHTSSSTPRAEPSPRERPRPSIDDALSDLKRRAGTSGASSSAPRPSQGKPSGTASRPASTVDDELAALKRKMASAPKKK
ncbi:MAG TPA: hypothetical protein VM513_28130, partial [Kofleriaceae bacterium]|nr:hypothetical protein [Kofleriaceae bacterium]